jgi:hypothetical protein
MGIRRLDALHEWDISARPRIGRLGEGLRTGIDKLLEENLGTVAFPSF